MDCIAHSRIELTPQDAPSGAGGQASRGCCACGLLISGGGGGGMYICKSCLDVLDCGLLSREFAEAHKLLTT